MRALIGFGGMPRGAMFRQLMVMLCGLLLVAAAAPAQDDPLPAIFLVASPELADPNFRESVVLVIRHSGAPVGVIINRPTPVPLHHVFPEIPKVAASAEPIYRGGPVERRVLIFVFRASSPPENSIRLFDDLYMSFDPAVHRRLLARPDPLADLRVFAGYSGWAAGQLEREIERGGWLLAHADASVVFSKSPQRVWQEMVGRINSRRVTASAAPLQSRATASN